MKDVSPIRGFDTVRLHSWRGCKPTARRAALSAGQTCKLVLAQPGTIRHFATGSV
jgi:hypothetical protein